ncbi:hypothetical protein [Streptomyces sp. SAI-149]|uniref:hypothetical protein n=1 Tax=unclassified Streptomyces TaxID=2593676 RepID=UPI000F4D3605|nr:hypothetical protein [Streptomyces sp. SAI-149]
MRVLVEHLPSDSSYARAVHGEQADWTVTDHLLAAAVDHLAVANWMFATVHRDEDAEPAEYPEAVPRPGEGPTPTDTSLVDLSPAVEGRAAGPAEIVAFLSSPG